MRNSICTLLIILLITTPAWPTNFATAAEATPPLPQKALAFATSDAFQSLVVLTILYAAEIVQQKMYHAELRDQSASPAEVSRYAAEAASHILNEPTVWTGIVGHISSLVIGAEPASRLFFALAKDRQTNPIMVRFLQAGTVNIISAAGFIYGRELWAQARAMLKDPEDRLRASQMTSVLAGMTSLSLKNTHDPDARVLKQMLSHIYQILITRPKLRRQFLNGTWRKHIATGEFSAEVLTTVGSGVIGSALFQKSPRLAAIVFGVTGGLLSTFLPDEFKMAATDTLAWGRRLVDDVLIESCQIQLQHRPTRLMPHWEIMHRVSEMQQSFQDCEDHREDIVGLEIESVYRNAQLLNTLLTDQEVARNARNAQMIEEVGSRIQLRRAYLHEAARYIEDVYREQHQLLDRISSDSIEPISRRVVDCERRHLKIIENHLVPILNELVTRTTYSKRTNTSLLESYYDVGFDEDEVLKEQGVDPHECYDTLGLW